MKQSGIIELEELYEETRLDHFVMAISHLMDIGWSTAESITDKQLESCRGNSLMTKDFVVWINKTAREIAKNYEPAAVIAFCAYHDIFDTNIFADARENKVRLAIDAIDDLNDEYGLENNLPDTLGNYLGAVAEAAEAKEVQK